MLVVKSLSQLNIFRPYFATVLYNFVQYGTVQYRVPPPLTKVKFFSLHFWMNQAISNVFPRVLEKTQKNPKKSLDLAKTPPPSLENFQTFLGFFFEGFPNANESFFFRDQRKPHS